MIRLRLAIACLAIGGTAVQAEPAAEPAPADAPIRLANHRAVYDLSLARSSGPRAVEGAQGRIVIDFSGDACKGYTIVTRQVTVLTSGESGDRTSDLRNTTFESGDGKTFRFKTAAVSNGNSAEPVDGSADAEGDKLKVKIKEPKRDQLTVDEPVLFPSLHMRRLIQAARAGTPTLSTKLFDGSDDGRKIYDTLAVIGKAGAPPAAGGGDKPDRDKPLREGEIANMRRWPVVLSYYTSGSGERTPVYTISFDLYENGVSGNIRLDYGDFAIDGNMSQLEMHKADPKAEGECGK